MSKFVKKYEWVGDVESYKEPKENENSIFYTEPSLYPLPGNLFIS